MGIKCKGVPPERVPASRPSCVVLWLKSCVGITLHLLEPIATDIIFNFSYAVSWSSRICFSLFQNGTTFRGKCNQNILVSIHRHCNNNYILKTRVLFLFANILLYTRSIHPGQYIQDWQIKKYYTKIIKNISSISIPNNLIFFRLLFLSHHSHVILSHSLVVQIME